MSTLKPLLIALFLLGCVVSSPDLVEAADTPLPRREAQVADRPVEVVARRSPYYRQWGCPDRYSCSPLYGAYGPYGGPGYWGAYSGWYR